MPMYSWLNTKTEQVVEVVRAVSEIDVPPTIDEALAGVGPADNEPAHDADDWIRVLSGGIGVRKTNAWGFGKGYWGSRTPGRGRQ